jgi:hypothetical protein
LTATPSELKISPLDGLDEVVPFDKLRVNFSAGHRPDPSLEKEGKLFNFITEPCTPLLFEEGPGEVQRLHAGFS